MLENERVGGPRQYTGPEAKVVSIWKCPACSEQNDGPLVEGCVHCGSGKPGVHKGVDPVVTPEERARILAAQQIKPVKAASWVKHMDAQGAFEVQGDAFQRWFAAICDEDENPARLWKIENVLREAFDAGYKRGVRSRAVSGLPDPAAKAGSVTSETEGADGTAGGDSDPTGSPAESSEAPVAFPPEQIRQRTLLAALRSFRESILPDAGEEVASGEWLAVADVDAWIVELEKELAL